MYGVGSAACVCKFLHLELWIKGLPLLARNRLIDIDFISVSTFFYRCLVGLFSLVLIGVFVAVVGVQSSSPVTLLNLSVGLRGSCCV